jgi:MFS family permease
VRTCQSNPIVRDLGISSNWFFAAFSGSLVISGLLGPPRRAIDRVGGRQVLSASNVIFAGGLALLGASTSIWMMVAAWLLLGVGMGLSLYDAAFGTLGRIYGDDARKAITGITLIAGFASTVGWPLSSFGLDAIGWRGTCFAWAAAHMLIGLPLNMFFLPKTVPLRQTSGSVVKPHIQIDHTMFDSFLSNSTRPLQPRAFKRRAGRRAWRTASLSQIRLLDELAAFLHRAITCPPRHDWYRRGRVFR